MEMAKVTSKGQITIPVSIRRRLRINEGDKLLFIDRPEGVVMVNPDMLGGGNRAEDQDFGIEYPETETGAAAKADTKADKKAKTKPKAEAETAAAVGAAAAETVDEPVTEAAEKAGEPLTEAADEPLTEAAHEPAAKPAAESSTAPAAPDAREKESVPAAAQPAAAGDRLAREQEAHRKQVQGLDLKELLNEIRSIGSNIK